MVRAESTDGGWTWSEGRDSAFPNPNAAVDFLKLASGNLLLVFNDSMTSRTPLVAALSTDGDRDVPPPAEHRRRPRRLRLPDRLPGRRRPHPRRLHVGPAAGDQPRGVHRVLASRGNRAGDAEEQESRRQSTRWPSSALLPVLPFCSSALLFFCLLFFCSPALLFLCSASVSTAPSRSSSPIARADPEMRGLLARSSRGRTRSGRAEAVGDELPDLVHVRSRPAQRQAVASAPRLDARRSRRRSAGSSCRPRKPIENDRSLVPMNSASRRGVAAMASISSSARASSMIATIRMLASAES